MTNDTIPPLGPDTPVVLEMSNISKSFGAVTAIVDVSLKLRKGEVLALVGDNGAGKSTLIKMMSGFHQPDTGRIFSNAGGPLCFASGCARPGYRDRLSGPGFDRRPQHLPQHVSW
jgi:simple sugar transport system ATP-binding protein